MFFFPVFWFKWKFQVSGESGELLAQSLRHTFDRRWPPPGYWSSGTLCPKVQVVVMYTENSLLCWVRHWHLQRKDLNMPAHRLSCVNAMLWGWGQDQLPRAAWAIKQISETVEYGMIFNPSNTENSPPPQRSVANVKIYKHYVVKKLTSDSYG